MNSIKIETTAEERFEGLPHGCQGEFIMGKGPARRESLEIFLSKTTK